MADNRVDQIVAEAFYKSAGVVAGARLTATPQGERPPRTRRTPNKWFNLDVPELECVAEDTAPWRRGNTQSPLIIQIILQSRQPLSTSAKPPEERVLEEWVLEYRPRDAASEPTEASTGMMTRRQAAYQDTHAIYKRLVIFHRSLYTYVRMLPAFKIWKGLKVGFPIFTCQRYPGSMVVPQRVMR
mmetsp:Transcript_5818/g.10472  ORF Transcript_5818/g.10472 Transcript_5818/m.10472 type:complete len:185 (+) Transcript_5818:321-875(+)